VKEKPKDKPKSTADLLKEYVLTLCWSKWVVIKTQPLKKAKDKDIYHMSYHLG